MNLKKRNQLSDILLTLAIGLLILVVGIYLIALVVSSLWNFVMPVLGLPAITPIQALALYVLFKVLKAEVRPRPKPVVLATAINSYKEETSNDIPKNFNA